MLTRRGDTWSEAVFRDDQVIASLVLPGFATTVAELWVDVEDDESAADIGERRRRGPDPLMPPLRDLRFPSSRPARRPRRPPPRLPRCHLAGLLDEAESVPIARDPEPDAPAPRILLIGQAPGLRATITDRPFAGVAGEKLRDWFERGGIPRDRLLGARSTSPPSPDAIPAASPAPAATASRRPRSRPSAAPGSTS